MQRKEGWYLQEGYRRLYGMYRRSNDPVPDGSSCCGTVSKGLPQRTAITLGMSTPTTQSIIERLNSHRKKPESY